MKKQQKWIKQKAEQDLAKHLKGERPKKKINGDVEKTVRPQERAGQEAEEWVKPRSAPHPADWCRVQWLKEAQGEQAEARKGASHEGGQSPTTKRLSKWRLWELHQEHLGSLLDWIPGSGYEMPKQFGLKAMEPDGACLFEGVAHFVNKIRNKTFKLATRTCILSHMKKYQEEYGSAWWDGEYSRGSKLDNFDQYLEHMTDPFAWEIMAATRHWNIKLWVVADRADL